MSAKDGFEGFGPFGGRHGRAFGPGFRVGRGLMEPAILGALSVKPMHGYEIITYLEERSRGIWRPSAGSIYPTLQLLEEKGLVISKEESGKKVYHLTDEGKKEADQASKLRAAMGENLSSHFHELKQSRRQLDGIMHAIQAIYRHGSDEQKSRLVKAINAFQDELERIRSGE